MGGDDRSPGGPGYRSGSALVCSSAPRSSDLPPPSLDPKGQETDILTLLRPDILALRLQSAFAETPLWNDLGASAGATGASEPTCPSTLPSCRRREMIGAP